MVKDPKTRIICITLGHDDKAHTNPSFKTLIQDVPYQRGEMGGEETNLNRLDRNSPFTAGPGTVDFMDPT